jgi:hypothetical protein
MIPLLRNVTYGTRADEHLLTDPMRLNSHNVVHSYVCFSTNSIVV